MTEYYVLETWGGDRARLHVASCPSCQDGAELHEGKWHGPYGNRMHALKFAEVLQRHTPAVCEECSP